jgi:hypothetical protein
VKSLLDEIARDRKEAAQGEANRFMGSPGLALSEVITGVWLMQTGLTAEAAEVLLPALDAHDSDQYLIEAARQQIGAMLGNRMLLAFGGSQDFAEALKIALRIDTVFRETRYHPQARRLAFSARTS